MALVAFKAQGQTNFITGISKAQIAVLPYVDVWINVGDTVVFLEFTKKVCHICWNGRVDDGYIETQHLSAISFSDSIRDNFRSIKKTYKADLETACAYYPNILKRKRDSIENIRLEKIAEERRIAEEKKRIEEEKQRIAEEKKRAEQKRIEEENRLSQARIDSLKKEKARLIELEFENLKQQYIDSFIKAQSKIGLCIYRWSWGYGFDGSSSPEISIEIGNYSKKTIKYITFYVRAYNPVDDIVLPISGNKAEKLKGVGPIAPLKDGEYTFDHTSYYSRVIETFKMTMIKVQYMDGTFRTYTGDILSKVILNLD